MRARRTSWYHLPLLMLILVLLLKLSRRIPSTDLCAWYSLCLEHFPQMFACLQTFPYLGLCLDVIFSMTPFLTTQFKIVVFTSTFFFPQVSSITELITNLHIIHIYLLISLFPVSTHTPLKAFYLFVLFMPIIPILRIIPWYIKANKFLFKK